MGPFYHCSGNISSAFLVYWTSPWKPCLRSLWSLWKPPFFTTRVHSYPCHQLIQLSALGDAELYLAGLCPFWDSWESLYRLHPPLHLPFRLQIETAALSFLPGLPGCCQCHWLYPRCHGLLQLWVFLMWWPWLRQLPRLCTSAVQVGTGFGHILLIFWAAPSGIVSIDYVMKQIWSAPLCCII